MNIQGGVEAFTPDSHKAINTGGRVKALPKIANFIDHYTPGLFCFYSSGQQFELLRLFASKPSRLVCFALLFPFQLQDLVI